jgi:hypothetical protein
VITRYTQPVQAQYIPMDTSTYEKMGQAVLAAGEKPWNLIMAMKERQAKDATMAQSFADQTAFDLQGIRAITPEDARALNQRKEYYQKALDKAISESGNNPSALLPVLTNINRQYKMDLAGGVLGNIKNRYAIGMENIKQAKKDFADNKLDQAAYQYQISNPLYMVPRTGDMATMSQNLLKNAEKSGLSKEDAYRNFMDLAHSKLGASYFNGPDSYKKFIDSQLNRSFNLYYQDSGEHSVLQPGSNAKFKDRKLINIDDRAFNSKGDFKSDYDPANPNGEVYSQNYTVQDVGGMKPIITRTRMSAEEEETAKNKYEEDRKKLDEYAEAFGIPKDLSSKEKRDKINELYNKTAARYEEVLKINSKDAPDLKTMNFRNKTVTLDGKKVDNSKIDDIVKNIAEEKSGSGWQLVSKKPLINPVTGELLYKVHYDKEDHTIGIKGYNTELESSLAPYSAIVSNVAKGNFGKKIDIVGKAASGNRQVVYDQVEVKPRFDEKNRQTTFDVYLYNHGKPIMNSKGKQIEIPLDYFGREAKNVVDETYK